MVKSLAETPYRLAREAQLSPLTTSMALQSALAPSVNVRGLDNERAALRESRLAVELDIELVSWILGTSTSIFLVTLAVLSFRQRPFVQLLTTPWTVERSSSAAPNVPTVNAALAGL